MKADSSPAPFPLYPHGLEQCLAQTRWSMLLRNKYIIEYINVFEGKPNTLTVYLGFKFLQSGVF